MAAAALTLGIGLVILDSSRQGQELCRRGGMDELVHDGEVHVRNRPGLEGFGVRLRDTAEWRHIRRGSIVLGAEESSQYVKLEPVITTSSRGSKGSNLLISSEILVDVSAAKNEQRRASPGGTSGGRG